MAAIKQDRVEVRVPESEKRLYALAAARADETVSDFMRRAAREEARRTLAKDTTILLSTAEAQRFVATLDADVVDDTATRLADLNRHRDHFAT